MGKQKGIKIKMKYDVGLLSEISGKQTKYLSREYVDSRYYIDNTRVSNLDFMNDIYKVSLYVQPRLNHGHKSMFIREFYIDTTYILDIYHHDIFQFIEMVKQNPFIVLSSQELMGDFYLLTFAITIEPKLLEKINGYKISDELYIRILCNYYLMKYLIDEYDFVYYSYEIEYIQVLNRLMSDKKYQITFFERYWHNVLTDSKLSKYYDIYIKDKDFIELTKDFIPDECLDMYYNYFEIDYDSRKQFEVDNNNKEIQRITKERKKELFNRPFIKLCEEDKKELIDCFEKLTSIFDEDIDCINIEYGTFLTDDFYITLEDYQYRHINDLDFINTCIQQKLLVLPFSEKYKEDYHLWLDQIKNNPALILYMPKTLRRSRSFILRLRNYMNNVLLYCDNSLLNDKFFILKYMCSFTTQVNFRIGDALANDIDFFKDAYSIDDNILFYASDELKQTKEFIETFIDDGIIRGNKKHETAEAYPFLTFKKFYLEKNIMIDVNEAVECILMYKDYDLIDRLLKADPHMIFSHSKLFRDPFWLKKAIIYGNNSLLIDTVLRINKGGMNSVVLEYNFFYDLIVNHYIMVTQLFWIERLSYFGRDEKLKKCFYRNNILNIDENSAFFKKHYTSISEDELEELRIEGFDSICGKSKPNSADELKYENSKDFNDPFDKLSEDVKVKLIMGKFSMEDLEKSEIKLSQMLKSPTILKLFARNKIPVLNFFVYTEMEWLYSISINNALIEYLPKEYLSYSEFVINVRYFYKDILFICDKKLLDNETFLISYLQRFSAKDSFVLGDKLKNDKKFLKLAMTYDEYILNYASEKIKNDFIFMFNAVLYDFGNLRYAGKDIKERLENMYGGSIGSINRFPYI